jgi:hypothetical protein
MESNFIGYVVAFIVGAAVPIFINSLERKEKRKLFELERKDKYKLIAVEKRLEAHQKAFKYWSKLIEIIHEADDEKRNKLLSEAREFFFENNLYLEKKTRKEFYLNIGRISNHKTLLQIWRDSPRGQEKEKAHEELLKNWESIFNFPKVVQSDVEIEPITLKPEFDVEGNEIEPA